jgi:hypothetical protein
MLSRPVLEPFKPPIQWVLWAFSVGIMRPKYEPAHSLPTSAEVKNIWIYTAIASHVFMMSCLICYLHGRLYLYLVTQASLEDVKYFKRKFSWRRARSSEKKL